MDDQPGSRRSCRSGHGLCGAADHLRARVPRATGVCGPTTLSSSGRLSGTASSASAGRADRRLAGPPCGSSSRASASNSASTSSRASADSRRGSIGSAAAPGRGHSGCSESLLCLDAGLLGLERSLGMGQWPLGGPTQANRRLGEWPLGAVRPWLRLDPRRLALATTHSCGLITAMTMASDRRYFCATALTCSSVTAS